MQIDGVCVIRNIAHAFQRSEGLSELDWFRMLEFPDEPPEVPWV